MKAALLLVVACAMFCAPPARAADEPYRRSGFEVGGWRWHDDSYPGAGWWNVLSVGRWERVQRALTWVTRLEFGDLKPWDSHDGLVLQRPTYGLFQGHRWRDVGHSMTLETGIAVHPPVTAGLAPYLGGSFGIGSARWGNEYDDTGGVTTGRTAPAFALSAEIGLRVFPSGHWPSVCAALGYRSVFGPGGWGTTTEPVLSIGY
jgi:hypothetical protein